MATFNLLILILIKSKLSTKNLGTRIQALLENSLKASFPDSES